MDLSELRTETETVLKREGLTDWRLSIRSLGTNTFGRCDDKKKLIMVDDHYAKQAPKDDVMDTVLHEIAHALVGCQHGHNAIWRLVAERLGCTPKACSPNAQWLRPKAFTATCPGCSHSYGCEKMPNGKRRCSKPRCRSPLTFVRRGAKC